MCVTAHVNTKQQDPNKATIGDEFVIEEWTKNGDHRWTITHTSFYVILITFYLQFYTLNRISKYAKGKRIAIPAGCRTPLFTRFVSILGAVPTKWSSNFFKGSKWRPFWRKTCFLKKWGTAIAWYSINVVWGTEKTFTISSQFVPFPFYVILIPFYLQFYTLNLTIC